MNAIVVVDILLAPTRTVLLYGASPPPTPDPPRVDRTAAAAPRGSLYGLPSGLHAEGPDGRLAWTAAGTAGSVGTAAAQRLQPFHQNSPILTATPWLNSSLPALAVPV